MNHNYYKWNITLGDYYRDYESTERYAKKIANKKRIEKFAKIFIYMSISFSLLMICTSYLH